MSTIEAEAATFGARAKERVAHGHLPDLRRVTPCDWFYNNVWRRPYLVDLEFGRNFRFAEHYARGQTVLEVGCGVGHMMLEFARHGFAATGIDVAKGSIDVARAVAGENPYTEGFGSLRYVVDDFLAWRAPHRFDTICFFGTLHHFDDPGRILDRVDRLLAPGGTVVAVEPARDWLRPADAAIAALVRVLLAAHGAWYEHVPIPADRAALQEYVERCFVELTEARDPGEDPQSPHDNACAADTMLGALRARFDELECRPGLSLFQRLGAGVRAPSEEHARALAEFLHRFEALALELALLRPSEFLWAGRRR